MQTNFKKAARLTLGLIVLGLTVSCYKFGRIAAPKEIAGGAAFEGRINVINDGNNSTQTGLSFFAVRVPSNWNVTVAGDAYKQFAKEGTKNDQGEEVRRTCAMRYSEILASHLNETNPKEGFTWFAFQTTECIRRNIQGSGSNGCDSIAFDYTVYNDGIAGSYELDYMAGSMETENVNYLEYENKPLKDIVGSDIYRISTEQVYDKEQCGGNEFNNIYPEFKTTVKVLEGGEVINYSPAINVTVEGGKANVEYKNMIGVISVFKNAGTLALPLDFNVVGNQKMNSGTYSFDVTGLEPGTYHVRSLASGAEDTFTIAPRDYTPAGTSLFVIGGTKMLAPELLVDENDAYLLATAMEAGMFKQSPEILSRMIANVIETKPTALLVTGGLTFNGAKASHESMASLFKQVTDQGIKVFVVPGPEDVDNAEACKYEGEGTTPVENISAEDFARIYGHCGYDMAVTRDESTLSYMAYASDDLAILAIDACQPDKTGVITAATLSWMTEAALTAYRSGRQVVAIMNHLVMAPFNGYDKLGNVVNNAQKTDLGSMFGAGSEEQEETTPLDYVAADIQNTLAAYGISTVFVGGLNANDIQKTVAANGRDLYQVATGEAISYTCPYRLVNYKDDALEIQTRGISDMEIEGLGMPFEEYAYYRTKTMLPIAVSSAIEQNWEMINGILQTSFTFDYDPEVDIFNKNDFFVLPTTPEAFAKIVNDNFIPPFVNTMLTFIDGNENMKKSQELVDGMHAGWDGFVSALNTLPSIINPMVKEGFAAAGLDVDGMIDAIVRSLAYNYLGTEDNVSNDLFITIPVTFDISGISTVSGASTGATYYSVSGMKVQNANVPGLYIEKTADGKARTVVVK